jgi:4a-hydroxytetrahydrobiopterin dehydratase
METAKIKLREKQCVPCEGSVDPLGKKAIETYSQELGPGWQVKEGHSLEKIFSFDDFRGALQFTEAAGEIAEAEEHHPTIELSWGKAKVTVFTHAVDGLTENDFILAAKIDSIQE